MQIIFFIYLQSTCLIRDSDDSDAPSPINASPFSCPPRTSKLDKRVVCRNKRTLKRCAFKASSCLANWCTSLDGCTQLDNLPSLARPCWDDNCMLFRLILATSFALLCCVTLCDHVWPSQIEADTCRFLCRHTAGGLPLFLLIFTFFYLHSYC